MVPSGFVHHAGLTSGLLDLSAFKLALHIPRFYLILERIVVPAAIIGFAVAGLLFCAYLDLREKLQHRWRCVSRPAAREQPLEATDVD